MPLTRLWCLLSKFEQPSCSQDLELGCDDSWADSMLCGFRLPSGIPGSIEVPEVASGGAVGGQVPGFVDVLCWDDCKSLELD